jgi:hypothetical protein
MKTRLKKLALGWSLAFSVLCVGEFACPSLGSCAKGHTASCQQDDDDPGVFRIYNAEDLDIDVSEVNDPSVLIAQLEIGPTVSHYLVTGGLGFHHPRDSQKSFYVEQWNNSHMKDERLDPRVRRLIQLGDRGRKAAEDAIEIASPQLAMHLAIVLRSVGDETSIPLLLRKLEEITNGGQAPTVRQSEFRACLAITSALWELTGQKYSFTPEQWQTWWDGVSVGFVVARKREMIGEGDPRTQEFATELLEKLREKEYPTRDRIILQGPAMIPHLLAALEKEPVQLLDSETVIQQPRPMALRIAWTLDELGATHELSDMVRQYYFRSRFVETWNDPESQSVDELALCRALSHCGFSVFCDILLEAQATLAPGDVSGLESWLQSNSILFSRRFGQMPRFHSDPTRHPLWNQVAPASNPTREIADAVPAIVSAIRDRQIPMRRLAANLANDIALCSDARPNELVAALCDAWLAEEDTGVRSAIGLAMARMSTPMVVEAFSKGLRSDRPEIVAESVRYFGWLDIRLNDQNRADFELLVRMTQSEDDNLRTRAVRTLVNKAPNLLEPELSRLVNDPVDTVRDDLTNIDSNSISKDFLGIMIELANDSKLSIRQQAIRKVQEKARVADEETRRMCIERLRPLLRDPPVQNWVATAIIDIDGGMAYPILIDELRAGNDLDGMIHHHLKKLVDELLGR